ncbi:AAA domain-containing protein [Clostridium grantii]|uniref:Superfamily I DNA and/or RNA helicase n=1 Tax=Clostridium grantii DSM 8605 TaxID=1121316 RepID=A0A1M5X6Z8_9CLOT|nr:AAA domain-containing protein [Clostridium grantii]SHH95607.1 Superfamily I DNA and/or RNA helicase [Clostridium grantii DSM 8605]
MNEILSKYKERLINLSGRNRSLVSKTLPKIRAFDLFKVEEFSPGFMQKLLKFIIHRQSKEIKILPDYTVYHSEAMLQLENKLLNEEKEELEKVKEIIEIEMAKEQELHEDSKTEYNKKEEKLIEIRNKYAEKLEIEKEKLNGEKEKLIEYSHSLRALQREIKSIIKETGRSELYVGYPFVEGSLKDGTFVRAPLFIFPVDLMRDGDSYKLNNKDESTIFLNKVLLLAIAKHNEVKINNIETEFNEINENFIEDTLEILKENNIIIEKDNSELIKFKEYKKENMPSFQLGQLKLSFNLILGQFPIANSIYADYENLLAMDTSNKLLQDLLIATPNDEEKLLQINEAHGKLSFNEEEINLVTNLDYSQEKAVRLTNNIDKLVIYGPPGTGKSQTIANIISNALANNKTVLMVSQKRAALDVIYNRLAKLNTKALLIHDTEGDKKSFYNVVAQSLEVLGEDYEEYEKNILSISKEIDEKIQYLELLALSLHKERVFGLTLQSMYAKTKAIKNREDERYSYYASFRQKNVFKDVVYNELNEAIEGLKEKEIKSYKIYKELLSKNPFIDDLDLNMNFMDIDELSIKVQNIIAPIKAITEKANTDEAIYHKLMDNLKDNCYVLSEEKLEVLAEKINLEANKNLLEPINDGRWWSLKYWMNYSANKKIEEANELEFRNRFMQTKERLINLYKDIKIAFDDILIVKKALNERVYNIVVEDLLKGEDLTEYFNDVIKALYAIEEYKIELKTSKNLTKLQRKIMEYAFDLEGNNNIDDKTNKTEFAVNSLMEFVILYHIGEIEKEEEVQKAVEFLSQYKELVDKVNVNIKTKEDMVEQLILNKWNSNISLIEEEKSFKEFKRQANKKRALWPIRKYIEEYSHMILKVFPCFLASPETVSEILPLKEEFFDIVIFDEASQMYVENAIPTIFRGKQVIIAGDDKQLRPNGTFANRFVEEDEEYQEEMSAALEEESVLDLAKINYKGINLSYHYRSSFEELINFSNYAFYEGRLNISPNVNINSDCGGPIERIKVEGKWTNRANIEEAQIIVENVERILKERKNNETLGIITFNINQRTCIEDMLEKRARENQEFKELYTKEIDRVEDNEDVSLFVKNIENVQGDERDVIIFSVGYGKNEDNKISVNFGSLSQDGGENRLNVAISRAKKKIYVVTSVEPEELKVENTKNLGPKLFKKYLQYARAVSNSNKEEAQNILLSVLDTKSKNKEDVQYNKDFELEVGKALKKKGYEVHTEVGVSSYKIDLAIYDPIKSQYVLGIECDGATYRSFKSARERDIHRQRYFEARGWKMARIWSYDWWSNPEKEIEKICDIVKKIDEELAAKLA